MKNFPLFITILALAGCASGPAPKVNVESDPPGARVFYGQGANEDFGKARDYIGTTPFIWEPPHNGDEWKVTGAVVYSIFVPPAVTIEAHPPEGSTNLFLQRIVFHGGTIVHGADKIPSGIFFDMKKPPTK